MANEKVVTLDNLRKFKEKCDEKYSGGGIEVVDEIPEELSDANLDKLYRERSEDGVDNLQVINKEVTPAGDVTSSCNTTRNGTQISGYDAFNGYFDTSLNELYGDNFTVSSFTNVYTAYYPNVDGSPVSAIRIGTKNAGEIVLSNLPEGITKLKLIVGKYFSYNGSTGQKSYDETAVLEIEHPISGEGIDIFLEENPTEVEIDLSVISYHDGDDIYLNANGSSTTGRAFLYGFVAEGAESATFTSKKLAIKEEVEAVEERVTEVEELVDNAYDCIDDIEISLEETNERIGDIQIWKADRLPGAKEEYIDKILKVNNKLYQCIPNPEAGYVFADFSNCTGTNQITAANFEDFQRIVGKDFLNEFELVATENTIDFDYVLIQNEADITVGKRYRIALDEMDLEEEYDRNLFSDTGINNATVLLSNVPRLAILEYPDLPLSNIDCLSVNKYLFSEDEQSYTAYLDDIEDYGCGEYIDYLDLKINSNEGAEYDLSIVPMYEISTITVENDPIAYTFKNNGEIRFGSSSNLGYFYLTKRIDTAKIYVPLTKLVFRVKSWNDSKYSCLKIDFFEKNLDSSKSFSIRRLIAPSLDEQEIVISTDDEGNPLSIDLADYEIKISGDNVHFMSEDGTELIYADRRVRVLSVSFIFGVEGKPLFIWQPLGAGEGGTRIEEVDVLPEEGEEGTIYLLPSEAEPETGGTEKRNFVVFKVDSTDERPEIVKVSSPNGVTCLFSDPSTKRTKCQRLTSGKIKGKKYGNRIVDPLFLSSGNHNVLDILSYQYGVNNDDWQIVQLGEDKTSVKEQYFDDYNLFPVDSAIMHSDDKKLYFCQFDLSNVKFLTRVLYKNYSVGEETEAIIDVIYVKFVKNFEYLGTGVELKTKGFSGTICNNYLKIVSYYRYDPETELISVICKVTPMRF